MKKNNLLKISPSLLMIGFLIHDIEAGKKNQKLMNFMENIEYREEYGHMRISDLNISKSSEDSSFENSPSKRSSSERSFSEKNFSEKSSSEKSFSHDNKNQNESLKSISYDESDSSYSPQHKKPKIKTLYPIGQNPQTQKNLQTVGERLYPFTKTEKRPHEEIAQRHKSSQKIEKFQDNYKIFMINKTDHKKVTANKTASVHQNVPMNKIPPAINGNSKIRLDLNSENLKKIAQIAKKKNILLETIEVVQNKIYKKYLIDSEYLKSKYPNNQIIINFNEEETHESLMEDIKKKDNGQLKILFENCLHDYAKKEDYETDSLLEKNIGVHLANILHQLDLKVPYMNFQVKTTDIKTNFDNYYLLLRKIISENFNEINRIEKIKLENEIKNLSEDSLNSKEEKEELYRNFFQKVENYVLHKDFFESNDAIYYANKNSCLPSQRPICLANFDINLGAKFCCLQKFSYEFTLGEKKIVLDIVHPFIQRQILNRENNIANTINVFLQNHYGDYNVGLILEGKEEKTKDHLGEGPVEKVLLKVFDNYTYFFGKKLPQDKIEKILSTYNIFIDKILKENFYRNFQKYSLEKNYETFKVKNFLSYYNENLSDKNHEMTLEKLRFFSLFDPVCYFILEGYFESKTIEHEKEEKIDAKQEEEEEEKKKKKEEEKKKKEEEKKKKEEEKKKMIEEKKLKKRKEKELKKRKEKELRKEEENLETEKDLQDLQIQKQENKINLKRQHNVKTIGELREFQRIRDESQNQNIESINLSQKNLSPSMMDADSINKITSLLIENTPFILNLLQNQQFLNSQNFSLQQFMAMNRPTNTYQQNQQNLYMGLQQENPRASNFGASAIPQYEGMPEEPNDNISFLRDDQFSPSTPAITSPTKLHKPMPMYSGNFSLTVQSPFIHPSNVETPLRSDISSNSAFTPVKKQNSFTPAEKK